MPRGDDCVIKSVPIENLCPVTMDRGVAPGVEPDEPSGRRYVRNASGVQVEHHRPNHRRLFALARSTVRSSAHQLDGVDDMEDGRDDAVEVVVELALLDVLPEAATAAPFRRFVARSIQ